MDLNPQQRLAVEHVPGPLLILAGAGSGKTRVLTERVVHLIKSKICHPSQILAVTFTNKAADEMRRRVENLIPHFPLGVRSPPAKADEAGGLFDVAAKGPDPKKGGVEPRWGHAPLRGEGGFRTSDIWISTFHSACVRILRRHGEAVGLPPHFTIFDESDQLSVVKKVLADLNISEKLVSPASAVNKISRAKDDCIYPEDYPDGGFYESKVAAVYRKYDEELRKNGAADFGDLIMLTVRLFRTQPQVLRHCQDRFRHILVDEYQDTNHAQYELVRLLADRHKNICVVGDPDQSIYAWRGADINNILEFERDFPGAAVIKLEQNYRSTKNILAAADSVIANNISRKPKTLWTENEGGEPANIIETTGEREEGRAVIKEVKRLLDYGSKLCEQAVFYRTNAQSRIFEDELRREGIPYIIYGGIRFYDRAEIKNCIAYLRLINNPNDNVSLKRIINIPARGIGKTTVERLETMASSAGVSIYELIAFGCPASAGAIYHPTKVGRPLTLETDFNAGTRQRLASFAELLKELASLKGLPMPQVVTMAIEKTGYIKALKAEAAEEAADRIENIEELISAVDEACRQSPQMTLADFLDQVALVTDIDRYDENQDVLPLMTLHLAKGLEFQNVFIVGLEEGLLPHIRSMDESADLEEERRLFYVGMTRAKKRLYICHANERMVRGGYHCNIPSRFLEEIPEEVVSRLYSSRQSSKSISFELVENQPTSMRKFHDGLTDDFNQLPYEDLRATPARRSSSGGSNERRLPADAVVAGATGFKTGQRVLHSTFGKGIICRAEGRPGKQRLIVQFESGEIKRLSASHANLIPLQIS